MLVTSQAAGGVWFQAANVPEWRTALAVLYNVVIDGLGRQVLDNGVHQQLYNYEILQESDVNTEYFPNHNLDATTLTNVYTDPIYGFNVWQHYGKWD